MTETAQELRDQAAELLRRSVALDRAAGVAQIDDEVRVYARRLFADIEDPAAAAVSEPTDSPRVPKEGTITEPAPADGMSEFVKDLFDAHN